MPKEGKERKEHTIPPEAKQQWFGDYLLLGTLCTATPSPWHVHLRADCFRSDAVDQQRIVVLAHVWLGNYSIFLQHVLQQPVYGPFVSKTYEIIASSEELIRKKKTKLFQSKLLDTVHFQTKIWSWPKGAFRAPETVPNYLFTNTLLNWGNQNLQCQITPTIHKAAFWWKLRDSQYHDNWEASNLGPLVFWVPEQWALLANRGESWVLTREKPSSSTSEDSTHLAEGPGLPNSTSEALGLVKRPGSHGQPEGARLHLYLLYNL